MSTLRVSNIEAKADPSSPSVNEKVKITNSNGDVMLQLDGSTSGITTVGINTTTAAFTVDSAQNIQFVGIVTANSFSASETLSSPGVNATGVVTATSFVGNGINITGVVTATSFSGDGSSLTGIDATQIITGNTSVQTVDTGSDGHVKITTDGMEKVRVDSTGNLLINTTDQLVGGSQPGVQALGKSQPGLLAIGRNDGTLLNDYSLGQIKFLTQAGGGGFKTCAEIEVLADGTHSSSSKASKIVFRTAEDGEDITRERWRINNEGILTNQAGHHAHGSQDFINNYRSQFGVYSSAESGTNGSGAVGSGPFDSTYWQSEWDNKTLTYGMVNELNCEYNLSQQSRCNIGAHFRAYSPSGSDNTFPTSSSATGYWNPRGTALWAFARGIGGYNGCASIRADVEPYYGSGTAYYARVKFAATSGVGYGYHCDLGGHPFGGGNVGFYVRQISNQTQTGCAGFQYRRHDSNNTFTVLRVQSDNGSEIGSIKCTNSNTSFNTSSDYRLKENISEVTNAIDTIKQLPVKTFNFIGDTENITGFIAHEIQDAAPYAVNGVKDGTREVPATDENEQPILSDVEVDGVKQPAMETVPEYQSVDYGKLTPILTAALQEAIAKIETLEAQNAELAARLDAAGL